MYSRLDSAHRAIPVICGVITLVSCVGLLIWDTVPKRFPVHAHDQLGAFPLAMIAVAYIAYQIAHRPPLREFLKAIMLALAFLFWAANQLWPDYHLSTLFNDIAIVLFVLDVFLVIIGWPPASPDESFAETYSENDQ